MKQIIGIIFSLIFSICNAQKTIYDVLKKHNSESIPYINASELKKIKSDVILLDTRELFEYQTSHIKGAIHVGYDTFNINLVKQNIENSEAFIVVYCSIGIRSEKIAEQLKANGYKTVYNLYGGIFEWKHHKYTVYNSNNTETDSIHTYTKKWSKWLNQGIAVYD